MKLSDLRGAVSRGLASRLLRSYTVLVAWRVALLYLLLALLRLIFYIYNNELIEPLSSGGFGAALQGAFKFDTVSVIYSSGAWLILSLLPVRFRGADLYQRILFWLYMVSVVATIVVSNLADTIYFHYAQKRFTGDEFVFADNGNNIDLAIEFALGNWWMIIVAALLIVAVGYGYRLGARAEDLPSKSPKSWRLYYPLHTLILALVALAAIGGIRGGFGRAIRPLTLSNASQYVSSNAQAYMILSNPFCVIRTLGGEPLRSPKHFDKAALDTLYTPYHHPDRERAAASPYKGYNVMVFILESFSAENSAHLSPDLYKDGEVGYMPFLDSLMRSGVTLREMYANGGRSICGTPSVIGSLPSLKTPFVLIPQSLGESRQMPKILRDEGYSTSFFCGSVRNTMGFAAYTSSAGVESYYGQEDYEAARGRGDFDGAWGIPDVKFMDYVGSVLNETPKPFFASQFTISSHHPFKIPEGYEERVPKGETKIQPVTAYTDLALRNFFEKYSREEWFNKTIFFFVADHVSSEKFAERTLSYPGNHHIVGAIYTPDGSLRGEIEEVVQQADIMPTVLGLVGYDEPYFAFGRDIFNETERPKWSVSYDGETTAYMDGEVVKVSDEGRNGDLLRAYEQQYFEHIIESSYIVPAEHK
ncbi:MAG: LTA synthase family protein [Rikenellaceae bacterium]